MDTENKFKYMNYFLDKLSTNEHYRSADSEIMQVYTITIDERRRYTIDVAASSEDEALIIAKINKDKQKNNMNIIDKNCTVFTVRSDNNDDDE